MKKRILSVILSLMLLIGMSIPCAAAPIPDTNRNITYETIYLPDGSYLVTELVVESIPTPARLSTQYTSGKKTSTAYSSSGNVLFSLTVNGSFTYNGKTAEAISASYSYSINNSNWSLDGGSASYSGNTAKATATFHNKTTNIDRVLTVSLTCDIDGVLT